MKLSKVDLVGLKVYVYFNLHKKLFSVKAMEGLYKGLVVAHCDSIALQDVTPKVSQKGRDRVLQEKRKNVHAGLVGHVVLVDIPMVDSEDHKHITYNPYKYKTFVYTDSEKEYTGSEWVHISKNQGITTA
jgi:hypothetical protein